MARPQEVEKRRALAREAVAVLQREGTDVSMSRLADAMGIKRPTLLYHFPTKGHILEMALFDLLTEQAEQVLAELDKHEHPIDRLFAQMKAVHAFHHGREARVVFLSQAIASCAGERVVEIIDVGNRVFEVHRQGNVRRLHEGIAAGTVAPCDPEALVATTRALTDGLMVQRVMTGLELAPVHALIWAQLLAPLKIEAGARAAGGRGRATPVGRGRSGRGSPRAASSPGPLIAAAPESPVVWTPAPAHPWSSLTIYQPTANP